MWVLGQTEGKGRAPAHHRIGQWGCAWARIETGESVNGAPSSHCTARGFRGGRLRPARAIRLRWFTPARCLASAAGSRKRMRFWRHSSGSQSQPGGFEFRISDFFRSSAFGLRISPRFGLSSLRAESARRQPAVQVWGFRLRVSDFFRISVIGFGIWLPSCEFGHQQMKELRTSRRSSTTTRTTMARRPGG